MLRNSLFCTVVIILATACTTENKSQEPSFSIDKIGINQSPASPVDSTYAKYIFAYLEQEKTNFNLDNPQSQLRFVNETIDNQNNKHVSFQQVHNDVPVWGHEIIFHLDASNSVYHVSGEILAGIYELNTTPVLSADRVNDVIMQHDPWSSEAWKINDSELYVFNHNTKSYLTYRLTMAKGLLREFLFVNANDGSIVHKVSGTPTAVRF